MKYMAKFELNPMMVTKECPCRLPTVIANQLEILSS